MPRKLLFVLALLAVAPLSSGVHAGGVELGPNHKGLAIGNVPEWSGVRLNFSDKHLQRVDGINFTIWRARGVPSGSVNGLALGVWGPEAEDITGVSAGLVGVRAEHSASGILLGGVGLGAGEDLKGLAIGGLGMGVGNDLRGIAIGGLGMGVGRNLRGIGIGGLGMGVGEDASGILLAGLGAGIGENFRGIGLSLLGFGVGANATGLMASGLGFGVGKDFRGIAVGGLGMGVGGKMEGVALAGLGMGMRETRGITAASVMIRGYEMHGLSVSAYNRFDDSMEGLAIGLLNITHELHGVQLGLLNIAWDNPRGRRILPIVNWGG